MIKLVVMVIAAVSLSTTGHTSPMEEEAGPCDSITIDTPCTDRQADECRYECESAGLLRECGALQIEHHTSILEAAVDYREKVVSAIATRYAVRTEDAALPDWRTVDNWVTIVFGADTASTVLSAMLEVDEIPVPTKTLISLVIEECRPLGTSTSDQQADPMYFEIANELYNILYEDGDTSRHDDAIKMIEVMFKHGIVLSGVHYSVDTNWMFEELLEMHRRLITDGQNVYDKILHIIGDETTKVLIRDGVGLVAGAGLGCMTGGEFLGPTGCAGGALAGGVVSAVNNSVTEFIVEFWKLIN